MSAPKPPRKPPYPKLWDGPNAIGEGQIRYMDTVGLPYMTKSGPGFMARKKGPFVEVTGTSTFAPVLPFIRASQCMESSANFGASGDAYPQTDGSLRISKDKTSGSPVAKIKRSASAYLPTVNWISKDQKTVVSWISPGRYVMPQLSGYTTNSALPGSFVSGGLFGFGTSGDYPYKKDLWVNGTRYTSIGYVLGACVISVPVEGGNTARYLKIICSLSTVLRTRSSGYVSASRTVNDYADVLELIPLDKFGVYTRHNNLDTDWANMLTTREKQNNFLTTHAAFHFNASGTQAVCTASGGIHGDGWGDAGTAAILLDSSGIDRPTWARSTEINDSSANSSSTPNGNSQNGGQAGSSDSSYTSFSCFDYLLGSDTLTYIKQVATTEGSYTYAWQYTPPATVPPGATMSTDTTNTSTYTSTGSSSTQVFLGSTSIESYGGSSSSSTTVTTVDTAYWVNAVNTGSRWTSTGSTTSAQNNGSFIVVPIDLRIGAYLMSKHTSVYSGSGGSSRTSEAAVGHSGDPAYGKYAQPRPPLATWVGNSGGGTSTEVVYTLCVHLPSDVTDAGGKRVLYTWTAPDYSETDYLRDVGAEVVLDPKGNNIIASMYRIGGYPEYAAYNGDYYQDRLTVNPKLGQLMTAAISRTQGGTAEAPTFTYEDYSIDISPGTALVCLAFAHKSGEGVA